MKEENDGKNGEPGNFSERQILVFQKVPKLESFS
jgi:hypothetical protein